MTIQFDTESNIAEVAQFIDDTIAVANTNNVQFYMDGDNDHVSMDGIQCNGIFIDHPSPMLVTACNKSQHLWLPILVHESCHMDQWIEQSKVWIDSKIGSLDKMDILSLWLNGYVELNAQQLDNYIRSIRDVELDCEKRTVEKIKKYGLPIDPKEYTQRANAYVLFYNHMMKTRKWYVPGNEPYNNSKIWSQLPSTWLKSYEPIMCKDMMVAFS